MATRLEILAEQFRNESIARNSYQTKSAYDSNHPNALSNGDEKGKGEMAGRVGSLTDINLRIDNLGRNIYNSENQYSSGHPNAKSDGDDRGKGQIGERGSVGNNIDILSRIDNLGRIGAYGPNKKQYPDPADFK